LVEIAEALGFQATGLPVQASGSQEGLLKLDHDPAFDGNVQASGAGVMTDKADHQGTSVSAPSKRVHGSEAPGPQAWEVDPLFTADGF
jgi:hypothetical protein